MGVEPDEWETVTRLLVDAPIISAELLRQLTRVPPSTESWITFRPCRVRLRDESWCDRVYVHDVETVDLGGTAPSSGDTLDFSKIVEIVESPQRLPHTIADALYAAGESAMGGCYFALITRSGRRILCQTGNVVDFVALPSDVLPTDIVDVEPHADDARTAEHPIGPLEHSWSLYALPQ